MPLDEILRTGTPPNEDFKRDKFVPYFGAYSDARVYLDRLATNANDFDAQKDLCGLLFGDKSVAERMPLERILTHGSNFADTMAPYCKHNLDTILSKMTDEQVYELTTQLSAISGVNAEHDKLAKVVREYQDILEVIRRSKKDPNAAVDYMNKLVENAPELLAWFKKDYHPSDAAAILQSYLAHYAGKTRELFLDEHGRIDRKKAEKFYRENIKKVEEHYDKETKPDKKDDIRRDEIDPRYIEPARKIYPGLKEEKKKDDDKPAWEREQERRKDGIPM